MSIKAIVYTSNTGYTAEYAKILGEETGLPYYSLNKTSRELGKGDSIIYLGWLMAGSVKGYREAEAKYSIAAVCGVGMSAPDSNLEEVKKANKFPDKLPVFTLRGGYSPEKLRGIMKFTMKAFTKRVIKELSKKTKRTNEEDIMLNLMLHGGNFVSKDNLKEVLDWYNRQK